MGNVSTRLSRFEFACPCGCGFQAVDTDLVDILEDCADYFQVKNQAYRCYIIINSACRCREHNEVVQKQKIQYYKPYSSKSMHMFGMAVDFKLLVKFNSIKEKIDPGEVADYLCKMFPQKYGIGRYPTFTHFDIRPVMSRW